MRTGALLLVLGLAQVVLGKSLHGQNPASPEEKPPEKTIWEVEVQKGISYDDPSAFGPDKHKLDLYLPKGRKGYPVILFVHGGGWTIGSRANYWLLGQIYASKGIGMAVMSYRLSPLARHPDHIQDVAKAFAWVHHHIGEYGGNPDEIFLCGHSAGAHLTSLLTTNDQYLKKENLEVSRIRGVIPICGIYKLHYGWADEAPIKGWDWPGRRWRSLLISPLIEIVVGREEEAVASASPLFHVTGKEPPFLLIQAKNDISGISRMANDFHRELKMKGVQVECHEIADRTHGSIMWNMMLNEKDPVNQKIIEFIHRPKSKPTDSEVAREK